MSNKNDRWSALSMKERADLMNMYITNGISDLKEMKKHYNSFAPGGPIEVDEYGYPADITPAVITQDAEFNKFLMTLPDNQRLTPEEDYHTYQYWKINGRPKDFSEALNLGMYHYDSSDNSYHANSVAFDSKGVGHFMKPKHHPTVKYELDWYNKGIGTLEGGKQYPLQGEERKEWEDFRSQYQLDSTGVDYKYVPRKHYNSFGGGGRILDGTKTEQPLSGKKPTLEEFLQAKADSTRNAALEKSYNRKTGILIPYELSPARRKLNEDNVVTMREYADTSFVGPSLPIKEEKKKITGNLLRTYQRHYYKALKELEDNCEYGLNCIGTATDNYPQDSHTDNNNDFRENHSNYGFISIDESKAEPGDIVQSGAHGMIYASNNDGERLFNWSSGGPTEFDYVTNGHFGLKGLDYYRYVGTPKLIQQWTDEYNSKKAFGGRILDGTEEEQTTTGLPVGAGLATYSHPKYNHAEEAEMYSYLRSRGVPHVQASAIMGNIAVESMLNPEITQIGGGGGYGLIQATDRSRKKAFINYDGQPYEFGSNISPETQRQLDYIIDKGLNTQTKGEWRGNHNIGRASVARRKFLEAADINKASKIFTENYLRPGKPHTKRRKSMSNYFNDNYGITERALKEFENSFLFQNN